MVEIAGSHLDCCLSDETTGSPMGTISKFEFGYWVYYELHLVKRSLGSEHMFLKSWEMDGFWSLWWFVGGSGFKEMKEFSNLEARAVQEIMDCLTLLEGIKLMHPHLSLLILYLQECLIYLISFLANFHLYVVVPPFGCQLNDLSKLIDARSNLKNIFLKKKKRTTHLVKELN